MDYSSKQNQALAWWLSTTASIVFLDLLATIASEKATCIEDSRV
jgi:hypothetical protein